MGALTGFAKAMEIQGGLGLARDVPGKPPLTKAELFGELQVAQPTAEVVIEDKFIQGLAKLETAGGAKTVKGDGVDTYNLFNIKGEGPAGSIKAKDKVEGSDNAYRAYTSYDESIADLKDLLARKYPDALKAKTGREFAEALKKGGYATDPDYVEKLTKVIGE